MATERRVREVAADDAEGRRARRSTANGVLTLLKAALNHAFRMGRVADDTPWRRVRPFQKVSAARVRYLSDDEARRLANACPPDLRALVTELRDAGLLAPDAEVASFEELLTVLEGTSGMLADTVDVPPLNVPSVRTSWQELR